MTDFTDRNTLVTIRAALLRALNSLDHEIEPHRAAVAAYDTSGRLRRTLANKQTRDRHAAKLAVLTKSRDDMTALYNGMDSAIRQCK